jgi:PAS domain S-box-containing protein
VDDFARMMMDDDDSPPDGSGQDFWMAPQLPFALRQRIETVFEVLAHLPLDQSVAVVSDVGKTVAVNAPLIRLAGVAADDLVGRQWSRVMPGWPDRARGFRGEGSQVFEEHLGLPDGEQVWVRVSLGPVVERGEERAMAYLLFLSRPDVETVDHEEVRRLRKSLELLAETQTDLVVEVDRSGVMSFVSPSFCRAIGAAEKELVGHEFLSRVFPGDRAIASEALREAFKPPFNGEMRVRLAADRGKVLEWQIDAVIGDGIVGLDLVGREPALEVAARAGAASASPDDPRWAAIRECLEALEPGGNDGFTALARAVAAAAGTECVLYNVMRGEAVETTVGWRLPPSDPG